ncbi:putative DNA double-strand break repair Rad50 ATPase [Frankliniella fusca]|uniref:DNA double-strand break repair Rad50 ATPase n=1 Tax=Frankliniella fusca TaxID=407009 RepID=A0AAE1H9Z2_9NEOP|nr:putative DNA double-strand break repair Rad50 ATPase [Frankliniella fusca]
MIFTMMSCCCKPRINPSPICCCSWPPKPHQCFCRDNSPVRNIVTCQNFTPDCPCSNYACRPRQPPFRTMQKALVDKWMEVEKMGKLAHMYWCQHRALQQQLACLQTKYCRLQNWGYSEGETMDNCRCRPENPSVYQGVLRLGDKNSPQNQLCICNNTQQAMTTYRGEVRIHDQDENEGRCCKPATCGNDYSFLETEKLRIKCQMEELNRRLNEVKKCEELTHERLQRLREELAYLETKMKSNWGQNAVDRCTPAKENQTRFF